MNLPKDPAGSGEPGEGLAPWDSNSWPRICPHPKHPKPAGSAPFPKREFGSFPGFPGKSGSCPGSGESCHGSSKGQQFLSPVFCPKTARFSPIPCVWNLPRIQGAQPCWESGWIGIGMDWEKLEGLGPEVDPDSGILWDGRCREPGLFP